MRLGELNDEIGFFPANRTAPFQNETGNQIKQKREKISILIRPIEPEAIEVTNVIYDEDIVKLI